MKYISYVIARDYGFAPNPFHGVCTLATCKPVIRNAAEVGDWVFGSGAVSLGRRGYLILAMRVTDKLTYDDYFQSSQYQCKKPILHGSLKQTYGDNIYHRDSHGEWIQSDSHHSNPDGTVNLHNRKRDTKSKYVLISKDFYFFGENAIKPAAPLNNALFQGRNFKYIDESEGSKLVKYLRDNFELGYHGNPIQFHNFTRYDGLS